MAENTGEITPIKGKGITRRDFLKIGGVGLLALLTGCSIPDSPQMTPIIPPKDTRKLPAPTPQGDKDIDESLMNAKEPPATQEQINYIRNNSRNPSDMILERLQGQTRLVGLGEMHNELDMELFANSIISRAAEQWLISFLALEIDVNKQGDIDNFMRTGEVSENLQQILNQHNNGYRQILDTAKARKLSILCVDNHNTNDRDDFMSRTIINYMSSHQSDKGLFYAGNGHMIERHDVLASELGDPYYSVLQINGQAEITKETVYYAALKAGITEPVGIDNVSQTPFSKATYGHPYELWSEYGRIADALVLLPPEK